MYIYYVLMHPRLLERLWKLHCYCLMAESVFFYSPLEIRHTHWKLQDKSRDIHKQTWSECLALSLVLEWAKGTQQGAAALELSIVLKADILDDFVFPLACASVWVGICIHQCAGILEGWRGVEICENTPGIWQPVTVLIRMSDDWWVTDGRVKMTKKCAAFQW